MPRDYRLYVDDILDSIKAVQGFVEGMDFESFCTDRKTVDAVVRNLEIIGEAAKRIPEEIKSRHKDIEWNKITGLRNLLVHEYFGINKTIIWNIIKEKLEKLKEVCSEMLD